MSGVLSALVGYLFLASSNIHRFEGNVDIKADMGRGYEFVQLRSEQLNGAYLNKIEIHMADEGKDENGKPSRTFAWFGNRMERLVVRDANGDGLPDILYLNERMTTGMLLSYDASTGQVALIPAAVEDFWNEDGKAR